MKRFLISAAALVLAALSSVAWSDDSPGRRATDVPGIALLAGALDGRDAIDGQGSQARFADSEGHRTRNRPGLAIDSAGRLYVGDLGNQTIRRIGPDGVVSTFAGRARSRGHADGPAREARFNDPAGVVADARGNLYVADSGNHVIRRIDRDGTVSTLAGMAGMAGDANGVARSARFRNPQSLAIDAEGNLVVTDLGNQLVRRVTPEGLVSTLAGQSGRFGDDDGPRAQATLNYPFGVAVDANGSIFVSQLHGESIRRIEPNGAVSSLVAKVASPTWLETIGSKPDFSGVTGLYLDQRGRVFVTDPERHRIRSISRTGAVFNVAGSFQRGSTWGDQDGAALQARFYLPSAVVADGAGNAYVFDAGNATVRKLSVDGTVSTLAGRARNRFFDSRAADGRHEQARFDFQDTRFAAVAALAADAQMNVYVAETRTHTVRRIDRDGKVITLAGAKGEKGSADGQGPAARFASPVGLTVDPRGTVFVCDNNNHTVRRIDADGKVSTIAGAAGQSGEIDGTGTESRFDGPSGIASDKLGNLYVTDAGGHTLRRIDTQGRVTTVAGKAGQKGDADGAGAQARFEEPSGVAIDRDGNVYVVDGRIEQRVRRISPSGQVTTWSTLWKRPASVPPSSPAQPDFFRWLTFDDSGVLYVVEASRHVVWRVSPDGLASVAVGDANWPGQAPGALPGHLDHPSGIAWLGGRRLAVTSGNAVFQVNLP